MTPYNRFITLAYPPVIVGYNVLPGTLQLDARCKTLAALEQWCTLKDASPQGNTLNIPGGSVSGPTTWITCELGVVFTMALLWFMVRPCWVCRYDLVRLHVFLDDVSLLNLIIRAREI